jgi:hypothetical protein
MNANTTPFASNAQLSSNVSRPMGGTARGLRSVIAADENRPQVLPLVLAVLPLRPVIQNGRASPRHA